MNIDIHSYKNPFLNRDANSDSVADINKYWCDPTHVELSEFLYSDKALFYEGSRGCGKTTIFRYLSFESQQLLGKNIETIINNNEYVCLYYRIGEFNYKSLNGKGLTVDFWRHLFVHIIELKLFRLMVNFIESNLIDKDWFDEIEFFKSISNVINVNHIDTFDELSKLISDLINSVNDFIRRRSISDVIFEPCKWFSRFELLCALSNEINRQVPNGKMIKIAFIIDEFESLSRECQIEINTYVKFLPQNISLRIGSRPAGRTTFETNTEEALRENHDYFLTIINPYIHIKDYTNMLIELANKRLNSSELFEGTVADIESLLGAKEDLYEEIKSIIPDGYKDHFKLLNKELSQQEVNKLASDDILQELLNIVKVNRGRESVDEIYEQMTSYNNKINTKSKEYVKYKNDFQNKYRKSLIFLLLSLLKENKLYYSMNTFAYLSSGSIRVFMHLCYKTIELAMYYNIEKLLSGSSIDIKLQDEAARIVAESELKYLMSIGPNKSVMFNFINNICKLFEYYHIDSQMKYPETNQFVLADDLTKDQNDLIELARLHSFIIMKDKLQQASIGEAKTIVYTVNRIYSPLYNISVVTRGGFNPKINSLVMEQFCNNRYNRPDQVFNVYSKIPDLILESDNQNEDNYEQITFGDLI